MIFFKQFKINRLKKKIKAIDKDVKFIDEVLVSTFSPCEEAREKRRELRMKRMYLSCDLLNLRRS